MELTYDNWMEIIQYLNGQCIKYLGRCNKQLQQFINSETLKRHLLLNRLQYRYREDVKMSELLEVLYELEKNYNNITKFNTIPWVWDYHNSKQFNVMLKKKVGIVDMDDVSTDDVLLVHEFLKPRAELFTLYDIPNDTKLYYLTLAFNDEMEDGDLIKLLEDSEVDDTTVKQLCLKYNRVSILNKKYKSFNYKDIINTGYSTFETNNKDNLISAYLLNGGNMMYIDNWKLLYESENPNLFYSKFPNRFISNKYFKMGLDGILYNGAGYREEKYMIYYYIAGCLMRRSYNMAIDYEYLSAIIKNLSEEDIKIVRKFSLYLLDKELIKILYKEKHHLLYADMVLYNVDMRKHKVIFDVMDEIYKDGLLSIAGTLENLEINNIHKINFYSVMMLCIKDKKHKSSCIEIIKRKSKTLSSSYNKIKQAIIHALLEDIL
ncbi:Hypothetical protein ORPV_142 [Orpheovirus IHUMI-LCC2]|uniref:Uncharacterized protein n=1 Tax=Orpheovirus IHUMI-LCC2 TaxID=2023057 RepID=A0A2I2L3E2_9VIRU|nr:Hypothetical protein ORPV_142 [Orpheovirus IHUMI-LCC2]SNW62046.1 Hypothetical protein ORPV_142 [Orpheovirus IHUMI-LCC2]